MPSGSTITSDFQCPRNPETSANALRQNQNPPSQTTPTMSEKPVDPVLAPTAESASAVVEPNPIDAAPAAPADAKSVPQENVVTKAAGSPQAQLLALLPSIIEEAGHKEMWGVELVADSGNVPTSIVLEKFLRANTNDVTAAKSQLTKALMWRKEMNPQKLLSDTEFDASKFGGLGFVTTYKSVDEKEKEIVTWNIYGAVKDNKATFGDVGEYDA